MNTALTPRLPFVAALSIGLLTPVPFAQAEQPDVQAASGSVAVGRDVRDSTITIGIPPEQLEALVQQDHDLSEAQKKLIAELEAKLDLNQNQVRAALEILGEKDIPPERLAAKLVEIAERFKALQAEMLAQPSDTAKVATLKAEAQKAIEAGDLAKADALLADVETEQRRMRDGLAVNLAETSARRGDIALARLQYREAALHFANAAAALPPESTHEEKRSGYLAKEAGALYRQGDEFGDNDALRAAIELGKRLISLNPRERVALDWAMTQNNLGNALSTLGERESGTARLEEAVQAYREALKEYTRERAPLGWAVTQNNLGAALRSFGERESGTSRLEEAVQAYREALKEYTRERVPLQSYREALKELTRERVPSRWAGTQNNLESALKLLDERKRQTRGESRNGR